MKLKITFNKRILCALLGAACGGTEVEPPAQTPAVPEVYAFTGRGGQDSVSYSGQAFRHVLIASLEKHIDGLTARIDMGTLTPTTGAVVRELSFFLDFDSATGGEVPHGLATTPAPLQTKFGEVSSNKTLTEKLPNRDTVGQHKDWTTSFVGWPGTPESAIRGWFSEIEAAAIARANGNIPRDPAGQPIGPVYVTAAGRDLKQLIRKTLDGAVGYSQGTDDYLDDDLEGKGINADHSKLVDGKPYTELEHQWDEGFGYFGAARDYLAYADAEIAKKGGRPDWQGAHDTNGDGKIDLLSEVSYAHSTNASKRDHDSVAKTDYSGDAMRAFLEGRALLARAQGALSTDERTALRSIRDRAVLAWERAVAATVVHYTNEVLRDMQKIGTGAYVFADHAKHWSELKGFALALQFNPRKKLSDAELAELHRAVGMAPALTADAAYTDGLRAARAMLQRAYGFDAANMGDQNGAGGW